VSVDASTSLTELLRVTDSGIEVLLDDEPVRLTGGRSSDLFRVRLRAGPSDLVDRPVVLRIESASMSRPLGAVIQQGVAQLGFPTPRVLRLGVDGASRSCIVMDWADGSPLFDSLGAFRATRAAPARLAQLMGSLHRVDPTPVLAQLDDLDDGEPRVVPRALRDIEEGVLAMEFGLSRQLLDWLAAHRPTPTSEVVCHGDLHAFNVLVTADNDVVIDWELAGLGPREFDVARTKLLFEAIPFNVPTLARPILQRIGHRGAERFEHSYGDLGPLDIVALTWFEALHCARIIGLFGAAAPGEVNEVVDGWRPTLPFLRRKVKDLCGVQLPSS
jgi:aminoglycoside phosphotransferase (APT) family kinase protein